MGGFFSQPDPPAPAPAPVYVPPPEPAAIPVAAPADDPDKAAREARIKALIRRRRGRAGLTVSGERGVLVAPAVAGLLGTKLGE